MEKFEGLAELFLNNNSLTYLPPSIGLCTDLEDLNILFNPLSVRPKVNPGNTFLIVFQKWPTQSHNLRKMLLLPLIFTESRTLSAFTSTFQSLNVHHVHSLTSLYSTHTQPHTDE
jgi:Leucine-rich repeat (LRR) protein